MISKKKISPWTMWTDGASTKLIIIYMIIITHVYMHGGYIYMHYTFMISLTRNNVPVAILFSVIWLLAPIRRKSVIFFVMSGNFSQFLSKETSHQIIHSQLFISFKPHLKFIYIIHTCIYIQGSTCIVKFTNTCT